MKNRFHRFHFYPRWIVGGLLAISLALALLGLGQCRKFHASSGTSPALRTAVVERRDFIRELRLNGVVEAVQSFGVVVPQFPGEGWSPQVVTQIIASGSRVKAGEVLVELDRQKQVSEAFDRKAEFTDLVEQIKKEQAAQSVNRSHDETALEEAENALHVAQLEMLKNEFLSRIDQEKNRENLNEAQAKLKELRETFELKRRAAEANLKILIIRRDRARNILEHALRNAERMILRSPADGLAVSELIWKSNNQFSEVQEGDEVRPGMTLLRVVRPEAMQVRCKVNQMDAIKLRAGMPVRIKLDAYPELNFCGRLTTLGGVGTASTISPKVHFFTALFSIEESTPQVTPDLSASVDVELERVPNVLVIPRDALRADGNQYYVEVHGVHGSERRRVEIKTWSDMEAVVASGLQAGEVVVRH